MTDPRDEIHDRYGDIWDRLFANSQPMLEAMAEEARKEREAGRTWPIDWLWSDPAIGGLSVWHAPIQYRAPRREKRRARKRRKA